MSLYIGEENSRLPLSLFPRANPSALLTSVFVVLGDPCILPWNPRLSGAIAIHFPLLNV